jgi:hypothetical protein
VLEAEHDLKPGAGLPDCRSDLEPRATQPSGVRLDVLLVKFYFFSTSLRSD